jgi:hypothetical protein
MRAVTLGIARGYSETLRPKGKASDYVLRPMGRRRMRAGGVERAGARPPSRGAVSLVRRLRGDSLRVVGMERVGLR